jgi:hypothetical protein
MKTNLLKIVTVVAFVSLLVSCSVTDKNVWNEVKEIKTYELSPTMSVADLQTAVGSNNPTVLYPVSTPTAPVADVIIEAYVTSNDTDGNFYKSISFQNLLNTATTPIIGFSVSVNKPMLFADGFTPGRKVYIKLNGLAIGKVFGSIQIGVADSTTSSGIAGIEPTDYLDYLFPSSTVVNEESLVRHMNLTNAVLDSNQNTLIEVDNVQFASSSLGRTLFDVDNGGYATNHNFIDAENGGKPRIIRFSQYATFSLVNVPSGRGGIRGVMTKYNTDYQFTIRQESDLKLTNPRQFMDDFATGIGAWTSYSVTGNEIWTPSSYGNPSYCATITGYAGGNKNNEDWLISPSINFTNKTIGKLIFDSATKYTGNSLQAYISTNYTSGAPSNATWTLLPASFAPVNSNYTWTNSGSINISSYASNQGNVRIAFKYTSTTSAAATWELDNVLVTAN